jgi:hypothetical protein
MQTNDFFYYQRRAQQERSQAANCKDDAAALAHLKMAEEYEQRAREADVNVKVSRGD